MGVSIRKGNTQALGYGIAAALNSTRKAEPMVLLNYGFNALVAGTVTVTSGKMGAIAGLTSDCVISLTCRVAGGTQGFLKADPASFTASQFVLASSSGTDTSTVAWWIWQPVYHWDFTGMTTGDYSNPQSVPVATTVTAADLPTVLSLCKQLDSVFRLHMGDTNAHTAADTTNPATLTAIAGVVDQTSANAYLNAWQTAFNAHIALATSHPVVDAVNTNGTAAATNLATSITLANSLVTSFNTHIARAMPGGHLVLTAD